MSQSSDRVALCKPGYRSRIEQTVCPCSCSMVVPATWAIIVGNVDFSSHSGSSGWMGCADNRGEGPMRSRELPMIGITTRISFLLAVVGGAVLSAGCHSTLLRKQPFTPPDVPKELSKVNLPEYRVEPPDILLIEAIRAIPKPPYRAEPLDVLYVSLANGPPPPNEQLVGPISVETDGTINLGASFGGSVTVAGKTLPEIKAIIEKHLATTVKLVDPKVTVSLSQGRTGQRISGPHLIRPDGTISLGTYGSVRVTGMTLAEVRRVVEMHLSQFLLDPEISVDVQNYNSKIFYVVLDGAGAGQTVVRLPITGNETVMDAVAQVNGLTAVSSQDRIWVSRPAPDGGCY